MDDDDQAAARDIAGAAEIFAARRAISRAVADLAASPLDVAAVDQMREALDSPKVKQALRTVARLRRPRPPHLSVVSDAASPAEDDQPRPAPPLGGAA